MSLVTTWDLYNEIQLKRPSDFKILLKTFKHVNMPDWLMNFVIDFLDHKLNSYCLSTFRFFI